MTSNTFLNTSRQKMGPLHRVFFIQNGSCLSDPTHKTAYSDELSVFNLQVELKPRPALEKKLNSNHPMTGRRFSVFHGKFFTNSRA